MTLRAPLFVPADRPDRFVKAASSGTDAVILDCEDAVAPGRKAEARQALQCDFTDLSVYVRINAIGTQWHADDLDAVAALPATGIVVPKAEASAAFSEILARREWTGGVIALIETVRGLADARVIAALPGVMALAFGSIDFSADCGCAHTRLALAAARSELVIASRLANIAAPIDGVTTEFINEALAEDDARHAAEMGFGGKLCIHPRQIAAVRCGLSPSAEDIAWARNIVGQGSTAIAVDGAMIDKAVQLRAHAILDRAY